MEKVQGSLVACRVACLIGFGIGRGDTAVGMNIAHPQKMFAAPPPLFRVGSHYVPRPDGDAKKSSATPTPHFSKGGMPENI